MLLSPVVANETGKSSKLYLIQLFYKFEELVFKFISKFLFFHTFGEKARISSNIVKMAISPFNMQKFITDDTLKCGNHQCTL